MQTILYITAPIIYILIILFSAWVGIANNRSRKGVGIQPILAILTGLSVCPLVAVLLQFGRLKIPSITIALPILCMTLGIGFFVGLTYIWVASFVFKDSSAIKSLFVLGTIGGSAICLYFYIFYSQVQELLISSAWGFLFGVLVYTVMKGDIKNTFSSSAR